MVLSEYPKILNIVYHILDDLSRKTAAGFMLRFFSLQSHRLLLAHRKDRKAVGVDVCKIERYLLDLPIFISREVIIPAFEVGAGGIHGAPILFSAAEGDGDAVQNMKEIAHAADCGVFFCK